MSAIPIVLFTVLGCVLVVLILGVALIISLVTSENPGTRTFGWILLACGLLAPLPLVLLGLMTLRVGAPTSGPTEFRMESVREAPVSIDVDQPPKESVVVTRSSAADLPSAWLPQVDQEFEADIYPSRASAATALGQRVATALKDSHPLTSDPITMVLKVDESLREQFDLAGEGLGNADTLTRKMGQQLRANLDGFRIITDSASQAGDDTIVVHLTLADWKRQPGTTGTGVQEVLSGTIAANSKSPGLEINQTVRFIDKPWVENASGSQLEVRASSNFRGATLRVARSQQLAATKEQAWRLTLDEADQLFMQLNPSGANELITALRDGELLADRFTQQLSRPYGDVYREAILINVDPLRIRNLQDRADAARAITTSNIARRVFGFIVMMAIVSVVYLILNTLTRGYYRMPIGIIMGTILVLVSLVIFFLSMDGTARELKPIRPLSSMSEHVAEVIRC